MKLFIVKDYPYRGIVEVLWYGKQEDPLRVFEMWKDGLNGVVPMPMEHILISKSLTSKGRLAITRHNMYDNEHLTIG